MLALGLTPSVLRVVITVALPILQLCGGRLSPVYSVRQVFARIF
jgi:hypothetical protein